jgi:hypothetical protein
MTTLDTENIIEDSGSLNDKDIERIGSTVLTIVSYTGMGAMALMSAPVSGTATIVALASLAVGGLVSVYKIFAE